MWKTVRDFMGMMIIFPLSTMGSLVSAGPEVRPNSRTQTYSTISYMVCLSHIWLWVLFLRVSWLDWIIAFICAFSFCLIIFRVFSLVWRTGSIWNPQGIGGGLQVVKFLQAPILVWVHLPFGWLYLVLHFLHILGFRSIYPALMRRIWYILLSDDDQARGLQAAEGMAEKGLRSVIPGPILRSMIFAA
jgi:hypothetical protein